MKVAANWKIAGLTLVTLPVAIWLLASTPMVHTPKLVIAAAFLPLFIALGMELRARWRQASEHPESYIEGSPTGNRFAVALAIVLIGLALWVVYSVVRQHT